MNGLLQDLRYALRQLREASGFAFSVMCIAALLPARRASILEPMQALRTE